MDLPALSALVETDRAAAGPALDLALRKNHGRGDARAMLSLHLLAAHYWQADPRQTSFHRTHAYVYALEIGDWGTVDTLYAALAAEGRI